jgi:hypothetical protein
MCGVKGPSEIISRTPTSGILCVRQALIPNPSPKREKGAFISALMAQTAAGTHPHPEMPGPFGPPQNRR